MDFLSCLERLHPLFLIRVELLPRRQLQSYATETSAFPEPVNFRALVPEISDTTYLTHSLFYYPAKFIPQIPRFCLREYTHEGDWVIDPFAGSGTVGLEAALMRRHAVLLDINPLLHHIVPLKIQFRHLDVNRTALIARLQAMRQNQDEFRPAWSNLDYWYDTNILATLAKYWGWIKRQPQDDPYVHIIQSALLKASRHFSYAEHRVSKLFKSKSKRAVIENLLQQDWRKSLDELIDQTALDAYRRAKMLARVLNENRDFQPQTLAFGGIDSANFSLDLEIEAQALITSPPYLQAQEYIRTSKLELYWLGYSEEEIKRISRLEIPYRKAEQVVHTPTLDRIRQAIQRADLRVILDSYFYYTLRALENAASLLSPHGYLCIFVGNPKVDEHEVETWRILSEYFGERGFRFLHVYEDEIKNRQLFRKRKNKNPQGMKSEFLLIMQRQ